jgi:hypothetical protein
VEEIQEGLRPLMHIQDKLLSMEKSFWQQLQQCNKCNILTKISQLLLCLTCLICQQEMLKFKATHNVQAVEQPITGHAGKPAPLTPFVATAVEQIGLETSDLDVYLSSVLVHLKMMKVRTIVNT